MRSKPRNPVPADPISFSTHHKNEHYSNYSIPSSTNNDNHCHHYRYEVDIYNSNTGFWKHLEVSPQQTKPSHREESTFIQITSCLFLDPHWAFSNGLIHSISAEGLDHIRFDNDAEKLTVTPVPPNPKIYSQEKVLYFGESSGRLILVQIPPSSGMGIRSPEILEMDMDGEGCCHWKEMYRVDLRPMIPVFPDIVDGTKSNFSVLCVVKGSSEKHYGLVLVIGDKVVFYDMKNQTNTFKELLQSDDLYFRAYGYLYVLSHPFIESLSPV